MPKKYYKINKKKFKYTKNEEKLSESFIQIYNERLKKI